MMKKIKTEHIVFFVLSVILLFAVVSYTSSFTKSNNGEEENNQEKTEEKMQMGREEINEMMIKASDIESFEFDYHDDGFSSTFIVLTFSIPNEAGAHEILRKAPGESNYVPVAVVQPGEEHSFNFSTNGTYYFEIQSHDQLNCSPYTLSFSTDW